MRKKYYKSLTIIIIFLTLTGCWDSTDIEKKNIQTTFIVDYMEDNYHFYTEIANILGQSSKKDEKDSKSNFNILSSKGKTLTEARDALDRKVDKKLFLGAVRVVIFTDRIADIGIEEYLNRLRGQYDYRKSLYLITTSNEPMDVLNSSPENSSSVGFSIESTLDSLKNDGHSINTNFANTLQVLAVEKAGFILPAFNILDKNLTLTGYSVFKDAKRVGKIPALKTKGVVYLLTPKSSFTYDITYKNRKYSTIITLKDKKVTTNYKKGQLNFKTSMKFDAMISYMDKMSVLTKNDMRELEKKLEKLTKEDIIQAIYTSQHEFNCDYLGFYKYFRANYITDFETIDWSNKYSDALMEVETNVSISESTVPMK